MEIVIREQARENWKIWEWQQQNVVRDVRDFKGHFPNIDPIFFDEMYKKSGERLKIQLTPYMVEQIPCSLTKDELERNPWFLQFFPLGKVYTEGTDAYNGTDNWEKGPEFPTSNLHHKYTNRVLVRFRTCLAYCNFCFEAKATLEKHPEKDKLFAWSDLQKSLEYISQSSNIEEVILSGGEPLLLSDSKLESILKDISDLKDSQGKPKVRFKRIHTRVMTHNPYRVTDNFVDLLSKYRVNELALNVAHPSEITSEFVEAVGKIRNRAGRYAPMIVTHTPLLKGVNDSSEVLWELFGKLFENNIKPYYLLHTMPHTPYADRQRVSVRDGVRLMKSLKRHKSNIAVPEYVIVHYDGKQTVPLEINGTPEFQYTEKQGSPFVRFLNWKGNWVEYPDTQDKIKIRST